MKWVIAFSGPQEVVHERRERPELRRELLVPNYARL